MAIDRNIAGVRPGEASVPSELYRRAIVDGRVADLHCHIIPGVDDGACSLEMAVQMVRLAYAQGVRHIACTSHSFGDRERYRENFVYLQRELEERGLDVRLYRGCEIDCTAESTAEILRRLEDGTYSPLGDSRYALLEFGPYSPSREILRCVRQLLWAFAERDGRVKRAVIAHVERYHNLQKDGEALNQLLEWGCLLQINAYSLEQESDPRIQTFARSLLRERKVSFLGSDAHRTNHRPPELESGVRYVYQHCDAAYADAVCYDNAVRLLSGAL